MLGLNVFLLNAFWIEKNWLSTGSLSEQWGRVLIALNAASVIIAPATLVYMHPNIHPVGSSVTLAFAAPVFLKLVSYHMVNYWCRKSLKKQFQRTSSVSSNLNGHMMTTRNSHRRYRSFSHNMNGGDNGAPANHNNNNSNGNGKVANGKVAAVSTLYDSSEEKVQYPNNLTLGDIYYFTFAPTLCYELNFPRSQRIRKRFLIRRGFEMVRNPRAIASRHFA